MIYFLLHKLSLSLTQSHTHTHTYTHTHTHTKAIYFLLHKLKLCVYRNLFKKAYNVLKKSQIKLEVRVFFYRKP